MNISFFLQLLLLHMICNKVNCFSKRWIWSTKWDDKRNWDKNRLPCSNDQIILAEGVIYLNKNVTVGNLELMSNGELVFGDNSELTIEETPKAGQSPKDCTGEPVKFTGNKPRNWFNPLNWNFMENNSVAAWNDGSLYIDRIPCVNDNVYFPEANSFVVSLDSNAKIGELYFGKKSFSNSELAAFVTSKDGQLSFKRKQNSQVTVSQKYCQQNVGCPCGYAKMKTAICSSFVCPSVCENKVTPDGDCCERCGALVKLDITAGFNLNSCQQILRQRLSKTNYNRAMLVISPIAVDNAVTKVQILVTDKSNGKDAVAAAQATANYLSGGAKVKECGSSNVKLITKNDGGKSGKTTGNKDKSSSSTIALAVTLSIVLVIVAIGALYLIHRRRQRASNINLQVLHNEMDMSGSRIEMRDIDFMKDALDLDSDYVVAAGKGIESFDNPMYDEMMGGGPAVIQAKSDSPRLEPIYAKPLRKSQKEEKGKTEKKKKDKKTLKLNGKSKSKKSESSDAFENPVYGHMEYTPDFEDTFDPGYDQPMPGDSGFSNPLYGDVHPIATPENLEGAMAREPPSFLDVIGFTPDDVDVSIHPNETGNVYEDTPKITVEVVGDVDEAFKGESEA